MSTNEILSDYERKLQVEHLKEMFPSLDEEVIENLLGAVDYDLESALTYLERFTEESSNARKFSSRTFTPAGQNTTARRNGESPMSNSASMPINLRENCSKAPLNASLQSTDFRQKARLREEAGRRSSVTEVYKSRNKAAEVPDDDDDYDDDNDYKDYDDDDEQDSHSHRISEDDDDDELQTDGFWPGSRQNNCVNEKFNAKTGKPKGKTTAFADLHPAIAVKAATSKKTAAAATSRASEKAPRASNDRKKQNVKVTDAPRSNKKVLQDAQGSSVLVASHDGIRGHLVVFQKVGSRVNPTHTTPAVSPAQKQLSRTTNVPTSARTPTAKNDGVASASRHHKSSVPTASNTSKPSSQVQAKDDGKTLRLTSSTVDSQTPRNFLKSNAVTSPRSPAESKSRTQEKLERDVSKVINHYELNENLNPKPQAKSNTNSQPSRMKQELDEMPANARVLSGAQIDLGELVLKALGRPDGASTKATPRDTHAQTPSKRTMQLNSRHEYELADTDSPIKYKRGKLLGKGAFGRVYLAFTDKGQLIAVKEIEICEPLRSSRNQFRPDERQSSVNMTAEAAQKRFEREFHSVARETQILSTIHHDNVVKFLGVYRRYDTRPGDELNCKIYIFTEYISGDTIANLLRQFGAFSEPITRHYIAQVLSGITFLHSHSIIHRDIKGQNVMVDKHGFVKLIDFGSAKKLTQQNTDVTDELRLSRQSSLNVALDQRFSTKGAASSGDTSDLTNKQYSLIGSPYWMAPEVIRQDGHSFKSDCWSLGCTVFEMATGTPPWFNLDPIVAMFHIGNGAEIPRLREYAPDFSLEAQEFVSHCLERDVNARYTAEQLLDSPFCTID